jgi:hypothetical protein
MTLSGFRSGRQKDGMTKRWGESCTPEEHFSVITCFCLFRSEPPLFSAQWYADSVPRHRDFSLYLQKNAGRIGNPSYEKRHATLGVLGAMSLRSAFPA